MQALYSAIRNIAGVCRAHVRNEIIMREFESSLGSSKNPEHDLLVLRETCSKLGLQHIGMHYHVQNFSATLQKDVDPARDWTFEVRTSAASPPGVLVLSGDLDEKAKNVPLLALLRAIGSKISQTS